MKQHKWHKEIKAWADGAEIEYRQTGINGIWTDFNCYSDFWIDDGRWEYRIKPQPKEPQYLYVYQNADLRKGVSMYTEEYKDLVYTQQNYIGKIKLEKDDAE